jgi:hypothetical protein
MPGRERMMRRLLAVSALLALVATMLVASPAQASITTYACNPSSTGWNLEGAWDDGSVMEARTCMQYDSVFGEVRTRSQWRARRGGVALSGTDWDLDSNGDSRPFHTSTYLHGPGMEIGVVRNYPDVFNTSIVTLYSNWACYGSGSQSYSGRAFDIRATPPGLPRSGYKSNGSATATDSRASCTV